MSPKPLLAAVVVLVVGVVAWLLLPAYEPVAVAGEITNTIATPEPSPSPSVGTLVNDASTTDATVRTAAATDTPAPPPRRGWRLSKAPEPWLPLLAGLPVVVVDLRGEPVAGASVAVFEPLTNGRRGPEPRERVITNAAGRARVTIMSECMVSAEHPGIGWSGDLHLRPATSRLPEELRLILVPKATVRGRVLLADGTAAAGARVFAESGAVDETSSTLPPFAADGDGRFRVEVRSGAFYSFTAEHRAQQTEPQWVKALAAGEVRDVTLSFAGAFSVRGLVLDADLRPARAQIHVVPIDELELRMLCTADCDPDGRFDVKLDRVGRHQVSAGIEGHAAAVAAVTVDAANPHASVAITLRRLVTVAGGVVDESATPCAGVNVHLAWIGQAASWYLSDVAIGMQGQGRETVTHGDGSFRFEAPAGRYCVRVQPDAANRWLRVHSAEFTAPASSVTVVVSTAAKQGFELSGTVVAANGSAVTSELRIGMCVPDAKSAAVGTGSDGTFRVGPFSVGHRYSFEVEAIGYAPTIVGPFDATVRCEQVTVQMQKWATVRCRVLRANGTPAGHALVRLERHPPAAFTSRTWQAETDADGRITFHNVVPATYRVMAKPTRQSPDAPAVEAVVLPGEDNDVEVVFGR